MLDLVLLTFIITFIFAACLRLIKKPIKGHSLEACPDAVLLIIILIIIAGLVALGSLAFVPMVTEQVQTIGRSIMKFDVYEFLESIDPRLAEEFEGLNVDAYIERAGNFMLGGVVGVGKFAVNLVLGFAISFILLVEKRRIAIFGDVMSRSRIAPIYKYFRIFGRNFVNSFAKVMKVQVLIALINAALSTIFLAILGFRSVVWGLGVMIFILGLIPVAGVIISLVPLSIIAFNIGGIIKVVQILVMVAVIHALEAYVLNPKLMANRTDLPMSFVLIILLVAEQYLGVWGLLIGVPLFIFMMTLFGVEYGEALSADEEAKKLARKEKKEAKREAKKKL
jgi:predicted PurR-regulated permease PerM